MQQAVPTVIVNTCRRPCNACIPMLRRWKPAALPPAFIATAECDVLHLEAEKYANALIRAGVHTQVARFAGITHGALRSHLPLLKEIADFLRRRFSALASTTTKLHLQTL